MSNQTVLSHVRCVMGQAGYDAADFKLADPSSVTTVADCVFSAYHAKRHETMERLVRNAETEADHEWVRKCEATWDQVREVLRSLGYPL